MHFKKFLFIVEAQENDVVYGRYFFAKIIRKVDCNEGN